MPPPRPTPASLASRRGGVKAARPGRSAGQRCGPGGPAAALVAGARGRHSRGRVLPLPSGAHDRAV